MFELESGNQKTDRRWAHKSSRFVGYIQPTQLSTRHLTTDILLKKMNYEIAVTEHQITVYIMTEGMFLLNVIERFYLPFLLSLIGVHQ